VVRFFWTCHVGPVLDTVIKEFRIFSRDEKNRMICGMSLTITNIKFFIGEVREYRSFRCLEFLEYVFKPLLETGPFL
jgi:hypothetical protein